MTRINNWLHSSKLGGGELRRGRERGVLSQRNDKCLRLDLSVSNTYEDIKVYSINSDNYKNQLKRVRKDREFYTRITDDETIAGNCRVRIQQDPLTPYQGSSHSPWL